MCITLFSNPSLLHYHLMFKELWSKPSFWHSWVFWHYLQRWSCLYNSLKPVLTDLLHWSCFKSRICIISAFFQYFRRLFLWFNRLIISILHLFSKINRLTLFLIDWKCPVQECLHPYSVIELIQLKTVLSL